MTTLAPERVAEVVAGWRRGLDDEELANPAGPLFSSGEYAVQEITMTGGAPITQCTIFTGSYDPFNGPCYCCLIE